MKLFYFILLSWLTMLNPAYSQWEMNFGIDIVAVSGSDCFDSTEVLSLTFHDGVHGLTNTGWEWNFGDGIILRNATKTVTHQYLVHGSYSIYVRQVDSQGLTVIDGMGVLVAAYHYVTINSTELCNDTCPIPDFSHGPDACFSQLIHFNDRLANLSHATESVSSLVWNFGDIDSDPNNTSTVPDPDHHFTEPHDYTVTLTYYSAGGCVRSFSKIVNPVFSLASIVEIPSYEINPNPCYVNTPVTVTFHGDTIASHYHQQNFAFEGVLSPILMSEPVTHVYTMPGIYVTHLELEGAGVECWLDFYDTIVVYDYAPLDCNDCIGSFSPEPGKKYMISAWVREEGAPVTKVNYDHPALKLTFLDDINTPTVLSDMLPKGEIIDGWQRIEEEFDVPLNAVNLQIQLLSNSGNCLFDDIRVVPFDGTMKSYVYDPLSLKLVAELDERNYATFYEYDEEGKLVRVKKETERGTMTVKESRNHLSNK